MRVLRAFIAVFAAVPSLLFADSPLASLDTMDDARGWEAVGRIEIAGIGFCTGTLIAPDLVLTAAHCLFEAQSGRRITDAEFTFRAGLRYGRALAERAVRRTAIPDGYVYQGPDGTSGSTHDVALLELASPIRSPAIRPIAVADTLFRTPEVGIVSYAHDRAEAPSMQESCTVIGTGNGVYVLSCNVDFGASGSPVFQIDGTGEVRVGAVVSAKAMLDDTRVAIGAPVADVLPGLVGSLRSAPSGPAQVRVLSPGERGETGARFVRPGGS